MSDILAPSGIIERLRPAVIVYGPQACGKTRNAAALCEAFGCAEIVDGWGERSEPDQLRSGVLYLTSIDLDGVPLSRGDHVGVLSVYYFDAMALLQFSGDF